MTGSIVKDYATVVMDGSNTEVVRNIIDVIDAITDGRRGRMSCHLLDKQHPTTMVIKTSTDVSTYDFVQKVIEKLYPGLCVFNPPM